MNGLNVCGVFMEIFGPHWNSMESPTENGGPQSHVWGPVWKDPGEKESKACR